MEEVVGAEGEADELLVAVVLDEQKAHDLGGVVRVERAHTVEHHLGGFPGVHGVDRRTGAVTRARSYQVLLLLGGGMKGRRGGRGGEKRWSYREGEDRSGVRCGGRAPVGVKSCASAAQ